ncbi:fungal-specific transcription factor domain-containing protein [Xylaria cf. heliscus]|nr:fungal-specific transcription factor domain-containing protein [Xylaria cf. heliscus]
MPSTGKNKAMRGCWTCKDRRIRCDLGFPSCANCARVQQVCQGYGMRLSWPRDGDTKRSIVSGVPGSLIKLPKRNNIELVHTSAFDIEMYYYLVELRSSRVDDEAVIQPAKLILPPPLPSMPVSLNAEELELLQYFRSTAFSTLSTVRVDVTGLRDLLVRLALSDHTIASRAVLHALLALSSLHRDSFQLQAAQHKTAAVGALAASARNGINSTVEAAQHVATNMLLCSFEIHMGTDSHGHWPWYLLGARDITKATGLESQIFRSDIRELILWIYHHDVMARFSLLHWRRESVPSFLAKELGAEGGWQRDLCAFVTKLKLNVGPLPTILRFLGDVVDTLCCSIQSSASMGTLQREIHAAELGVKSVPEPPIPPDFSTEEELDRMVALTELYRTAVLVYIARICVNKFDESRDLGPLLDRGFAQIEQMQSCERLFPIFILGCEANTDERRITVLNLLRRTENTHVRSLDCIRRGLESVWTQDDLHADQDMLLDYMNKLNVVVSSSHTLPTFV